MENTIIKKSYVPKFMVCWSYEKPELNFILHSESPKILVEVAENYNPNELDALRKDGAIFKEVVLEDGEIDLLVLIDLIDKDYFKGKSEKFTSDKLMSILDEMASWHIEEVADLDLDEE